MTQRKFGSTRLLKSAYVRFIVNTKKIINNDSIMQSKRYFRHNIEFELEVSSEDDAGHKVS